MQESQRWKKIRPFQENKPPKSERFFEEKASGLGGFKFWNYLRRRTHRYLVGPRSYTASAIPASASPPLFWLPTWAASCRTWWAFPWRVPRLPFSSGGGDYINDPLIGHVSDRTRTRWGTPSPIPALRAGVYGALVGTARHHRPGAYRRGGGPRSARGHDPRRHRMGRAARGHALWNTVEPYQEDKDINQRIKRIERIFW